jgi:hypothetical protein
MTAVTLRKLTIKTCGLDIATIKAALATGSKVDVLSIVGTSNGTRTGTTVIGEFLELKGMFAATNLVTGEIFNSAKCILPNFISEQLGDAIEQTGDVEFGVVIVAIKNEKSVTGYQFEVRSLIDAQPNDRMSKLMALMPAAKPLQLTLTDEQRQTAIDEVAQKQADEPAKPAPVATEKPKKK